MILANCLLSTKIIVDNLVIIYNLVFLFNLHRREYLKIHNLYISSKLELLIE